MARRPSTRVARLASEAFVIFAGVAVALAADDWRETRGERREVARSLAIIATDLQRDSLQVSLTQDGARQQAESGMWLLDRWKAERVPTDSAHAVLRVFDQAPRPSFSHAGYEGLSNGNRLGLIGSDELRDALFEYYQVDQASIEAYWEVVWQRRERLLTELAPHIEYLDPLHENSRLVLRGAWNSLTSDAVLHADLVRYAGSVLFAAELLVDLQRDVDALLAQVRQEVGGTQPGG